jgi:CRP-like cAMP-binding protein
MAEAPRGSVTSFPGARMRNESSQPNPLAVKLGRFVRLNEEELTAIDDMISRRRLIEADVELVAQGERLRHAAFLVEGWGIRYRMLRDGRRQILNFLLPGDMFDLCAFLLSKSDHSIATITPATVAQVDPRQFADLFRVHPRLAAAMWKSGLQEEAMLRERLVSLGRRTAEERIAHLLYELWVRFHMTRPSVGRSFEAPITQVELADAVGLTPIHVNRTLQRLRTKGLIERTRRTITILQPEEVSAYGEFVHDHLHLTPVEEENSTALAV